MSGLINKVKEAISGDKNTPEAAAANKGNNEYGHGHDSGLSGSHHNTGVDPRIDSGRDTTGTSGTSGFGHHDNTLGHQTTSSSGVGSGLTSSRDNHDHTSSSGVGSGLGHHNTSSSGVGSGLTSSRDNHDNTSSSGLGSGSGHHNTSSSGVGSGLTSGRDNTSSGIGSGISSSRDHTSTGSGIGSGIGNRDNQDGTNTSTSGGLTGAGSGITGDHHHKHHGHGEDIVHGGAHHTATANRLDPAVADNKALPFGGSSTGTSSSTGGLGRAGYDNTSSTGSGRNDYDNNSSSRTGGLGRDNYDSTSAGHQNTSGPHNASMMNKLDPRVDSDRDGKALGSGNTGNTGTHSGSNTDSFGNRNTNVGSAVGDGSQLDAAKHRPSEFHAVQGDPEILHDDPSHNRQGRHGSTAEYSKYGSGIH